MARRSLSPAPGGEADAAERRRRRSSASRDQRRVAALDPGADPVRGREVEGRPRGADGLQRLQPEVDRSSSGTEARRRRCTASQRESRSCRWRSHLGTRRATIAACRGRHESRPRIPANPEEKYLAARESSRAPAARPYTAPPNEAHLPAEEAQAGEDPRIPGPDEHPRRPRDPQAPPAQGPEAPDALRWRRHRAPSAGASRAAASSTGSTATAPRTRPATSSSTAFPRRGRRSATSEARRLRRAARSAAPSSGTGSSGPCARRSGAWPTGCRRSTTSSSSPAPSSAS